MERLPRPSYQTTLYIHISYAWKLLCLCSRSLAWRSSKLATHKRRQDGLILGSSYFITYFVCFTTQISTRPRSYRSHCFQHLYTMCMRDRFSELPDPLKARISSLLLVAVACSGNTWGKPNQIGKTLKLSQCWSMEAVSSALADPTLTALEIPQVNAYFARYAPKSLNLTASMDGAARLCLKSDATVCRPVSTSHTLSVDGLN